HLQLGAAPSTSSAELRVLLAKRLTTLTAEVLGKRPEVTAVLIDVLPEGFWFIGGESFERHGQATARLAIDITQGTNTSAQKAAFVEAAWQLLVELLGPLAEASYVIVRELPAGDWGYGGRTQAARRVSSQTALVTAH